MLFKHGIMGPHKEKAEAETFIRETTKPIKYTYGLGYRHPTTYKVPITKEQALDYVKNHYAIMDITEYDDYVHINEFSEMDMW